MTRNIEYVSYVGQDQLTSFHPHYRSLIENGPENYRFSANPTNDSEAEQKYTIFIDECIDKLKAAGLSQDDIQLFISKKHNGGQLIPKDAQLCFVPTVTSFFTHKPWFINIEDWTTLFNPHLAAPTYDLDIQNQPWFTAQKTILELPNFKKLLTHMDNTIASIPKLFGPDSPVCSKIEYLPMTYPEIDKSVLANKRKCDPRKLQFLFTNSYGGNTGNFNLRGGYETLNAFQKLHQRGIDFQLLICGPFHGIPEYAELLNSGKVSNINRMISEEELATLLLSTDVFVVPASRTHTLSVVRTMRFGVPILASDGWGFDQFIIDNYNGWMAKGQRGYTTWTDENLIMRDHYHRPHNPALGDSMVEIIQQIYDKPTILDDMFINCITYAKENFDIGRRNAIFKKQLDEMWGD